MLTASDLLSKSSHNVSQSLSEGDVQENLTQIPKWQLVEGKLERSFHFKNYYQTMAFVNAIACVAHAENHHPELIVNYNNCIVRFSTHSVNGISENDFICAAKIDAHIAVFLPRTLNH
ncbi:4a-hydroxytetrahydrobiopterin dehydratase [Bdellovibrio sp. HCB2-146]|uniref:4a-hydroxytetrahydrobiopterin dehydratase n=1 Tax=Bdellovibrio sp. HCB2-146 TaxID=3394362 RepID=UPI0039BD25A5